MLDAPLASVPLAMPAGSASPAPAERVPLSLLKPGTGARVVTVQPQGDDDVIAARLTELGFVSGEPVRLITRGPFGSDPLLVQVGGTRFALRRNEAARILVQPGVH